MKDYKIILLFTWFVLRIQKVVAQNCFTNWCMFLIIMG